MVVKSEQGISPIGHMRFFQCCYRKHEFENILRASGFSVTQNMGHSIMQGLMVVPWIKQFSSRKECARQSVHRIRTQTITPTQNDLEDTYKTAN